MKLNKGLLVLAAAFALGLAACGSGKGSSSEFKPASSSEGSSGETSSEGSSGGQSSSEGGSSSSEGGSSSSESSSGDSSSSSSSEEEEEVQLTFSGETDKADDTWVYWNDQEWTGSKVTVNTATKKGNTLTFDYTVVSGACDWGFQVFYKNSTLHAGASYRLTATINSKVAVADGLLKINGVSVPLHAGDNQIAVKYLEGISSFQFVASTAIGSNTFVISDWAWEGILDTPANFAVSDSLQATFTAVDGADHYLVKYYNADKAIIESESVAATGATLTKPASYPDGNYYASITAISALEEKYDSRESELVLFKIGDEEVVPAGGPKANMVFGEEANLPLDKFVYWNDQNWCGSTVTVNQAYTEEGLVYVDYTATGACGWGLQIFYKNSSLTAGTTYTVSFKIKVANAVTVEYGGSGETKAIAADTWTDVSYDNATATSFKLVVPVSDNVNTIQLKGFAWAAK